MEILDRYVSAVGKRLPYKMRGDIESELHSTLQDMLEDQSQKLDRPADQAMALELLRNYGSPEKVAAGYLPERYLIGPQMYPLFMLVLKIVLIVTGVLALVGFGIGLTAGQPSLLAILKTSGRSLLQYYGVAISVFGNLALAFAILERILPAKERLELKDEEAWDPADLLKEPDTDALAAWEPIVSILFAGAAIVIFNFYPNLLRATPSLNDLGSGKVVFYPILSAVFERYLPWLNSIWVLDIALGVALFRTRHWSKTSRLFAMLIKALEIWLAGAMLRGPSLLDFSSWPTGSEAILTLAPLLNTLIKLGLVGAMIGDAVELIKQLFRLVLPTRRNRSAVRG